MFFRSVAVSALVSRVAAPLRSSAGASEWCTQLGGRVGSTQISRKLMELWIMTKGVVHVLPPRRE